MRYDPEMPRTLIVANPISGRGRGRRSADALAQALRPARDVDLVFTTRRGDAARAAADIDRVDEIAVVGGDGTINEVVSGLQRFDRPIGVLPVGTANLLGTWLGMTGDPTQTARRIIEGRAVPFDIGRAGDQRFFAVGGVGFDAAVVRGLEARRRGAISRASYIRPTLGELYRYRPARLRVLVDEEPIADDGAWVLVCNIPHYAAYFRFAPDATPSDGRLDVVVLRRRSRWALVDLHRRALRGRTNPRSAIYARGERVRIECDDRSVPLQLDGDLAGETPVTFRVEPSLVRFFAATDR